MSDTPNPEWERRYRNALAETRAVIDGITEVTALVEQALHAWVGNGDRSQEQWRWHLDLQLGVAEMGARYNLLEMLGVPQGEGLLAHVLRQLQGIRVAINPGLHVDARDIWQSDDRLEEIYLRLDLDR